MSFNPNLPRILVALGGKSAERAVSIESGKQVAYALEELGYPTSILDVGNGKIMQVPEIETIEKDEKKMPRVEDLPMTDIVRHFSLVFIAMHGSFGEDGGLQSLLEEIKMKFTGSGAYSSAVSMQKAFTKKILRASGLPTADFQVVKSEKEKLEFQFPVVVKPLNQGSSVGVAICENQADYTFGIKSALEYSREVLIEPYLKQKEITVAVLEDEHGTPKALPVVEIIPKEKFFNLKAKYNGETEEIVPAKLSKELTEKVQDIAVKTHIALGCRHFSRVDMMVDSQNRPCVLELNSIPGLTPESLFPKAAKVAGMDFKALVEHLVKISL